MRVRATVTRALPADTSNLDLANAAEAVTIHMEFPEGDGPGGFQGAAVTLGFDADGAWSSEFLSRVLDTGNRVAGFVHATAKVLPEAAQFTPFPNNPSAWTWLGTAPPGFQMTALLLHESYVAVVEAELRSTAEGGSFRPHLHAPEDMNLRDLAALLELGPAGSSSRIHELDV